MTSIVLFANFRNEAHHVDWFVQHYRSIGVESFHIVDNGSTDGTAERLAAWPDVTVYRRTDSFRASRSGTAWLNALRARFGAGKWCLFADADEMLVYPGWPVVKLSDLAERMQRRGQHCLIAPMIDMFNADAPFSYDVQPGVHPLTTFPHFLPDLFRVQSSDQFPFIGFRGGAREYFFGEALTELTGTPSPNLRKVPLVYCQSDGSDYTTPHTVGIMPTADFTAAMLHFKINRHLVKVAQIEAYRCEHFNAGVEYRAYELALSRDTDKTNLPNRVATWAGVKDILERGLMHCPNHWRKFLTKLGCDLGNTEPEDKSLALWPSVATAVMLATSAKTNKGIEMCENQTSPHISSISEKVALAELRARDSKARRETLENEIAIFKLKLELSNLTAGNDGNS